MQKIPCFAFLTPAHTLVLRLFFLRVVQDCSVIKFLAFALNLVSEISVIVFVNKM